MKRVIVGRRQLQFFFTFLSFMFCRSEGLALSAKIPANTPTSNEEKLSE
jgi:hypothetical protein